MGKEMKRIEEVESKKANAQVEDHRGLKIASLSSTVISTVVYWAVGLVNTYTYSYTSDFKALYSLILIGSALFSFICFVICIVAIFKIKKRRYLYVICALIILYIIYAETMSAVFLNW